MSPWPSPLHLLMRATECSKTQPMRTLYAGETTAIVLWCSKYVVAPIMPRKSKADDRPERKIHKAHPAQALQAQQLCQFCQTIEQVRLSQSPTQQRREWTVAVRRWGKTNPMVAPPGSICDHGKSRLTAHRLGNLNTRTSK